jgi:hypothetical protein
VVKEKQDNLNGNFIHVFECSLFMGWKNTFGIDCSDLLKWFINLTDIITEMHPDNLKVKL